MPLSKINFTSMLLIVGLALTACGGDTTETSTAGTKPEVQAPAKPKPTEVKKVEALTVAPIETGEVEKVVKAVKTPEELGLKVFNKCKSCHTADMGGQNKVGPNLYGIVDKAAGAVEGFKYSLVMSNSDVIWTEDNLALYLTKPKTFMPKTKMTFIGLKKEADRTNVIAYLKSQSNDAQP